MKRLISSTASEIKRMSATELFQSIKASEGRTVVCENINHAQAMWPLTNAEVSVSFGGDMILLNGMDVLQPHVAGVDSETDVIARLKELSGAPIGVNLEPVAGEAALMESQIAIASGRKAVKETFEEASRLGFDFICLTGNPGTGVTNVEIEKAIRVAKASFDGLIIAGKMHSSGVDEPVISQTAIDQFITAGADVILLPCPGTVPGIREQEVYEACQQIKAAGKLSMSSIGTSQETSDEATIRELALASKRCGVDLQHIGDAGFGGMPTPENIMALSIAIRGKRHTYYRMSQSIVR